jgi:two-component system, OmpR family, sensor histidine kinase CiaH
LLGAALVTVLVTRRALVPIRSAFSTERRFVAAASHELRTPVTVIRSSAEILERERLVADDGRPLIDDVIAEAERLGTLVGDLITLATAQAGAIALDREGVELRAWFKGTSRRALALASADGIRLDIQSPSGSQDIVASVDAKRLEQLVQIIVHNAAQHSPTDSTITLGFEVDRGRERARIWVRDQGAGIAREDRERIFEPFARLRGERRADAGSGLGLAIARQLATDHAAELRVMDDAAGTGATLELLLPVLPEGTPLAPPTPAT